MAEQPNVTGDTPREPTFKVAQTVAPREAMASSLAVSEGSEAIAVFEETLTVAKRRRSTGHVRIETDTETTEAFAEMKLDRCRVEVTCVQVGRVVNEAPATRVEGDTTVTPVVEEHLVVVKQLVLVEELRIRHVREREWVSEPVTLRR